MDTMRESVSLTKAVDLKSCCAAAYQSDWARLLLGESFHPGGLALTEHLGVLLGLAPGQIVLDVAAGQGMSAIRLAQRFGCKVVGVDYGAESIATATATAATAGVADLVSFQQGDAEHLPVADGAFNAVICECAFCTFPDKPTAASEMMRVLKDGGQVGLSDITRSGPVPPDLQGLLAWIACIADAQPLDSYVQYLTSAGLSVDNVERHDTALNAMVRDIQGKLLGTELLVALKQVTLPANADLAQAKMLAKSAATAIAAGTFGYAVITATK